MTGLPENEAASSDLPGPVVFIDGECLLCNDTVAFLLARDRRNALWFAHLQGQLAEHWLAPEDRSVGPEGAVVFLEPSRSPAKTTGGLALLRILGHLGGAWSILSALAAIPGFGHLLTPAYRFVTRRRDRWFGRADACIMPSPELRARFLED